MFRGIISLLAASRFIAFEQSVLLNAYGQASLCPQIESLQNKQILTTLQQ